MPSASTKKSLVPPPALSLLAACGLIALGFLVLSRITLSRDSRDVPAGTHASPAASVPAESTSVIGERSRAPSDATPEPDAVRPETALLQELPEVRMTRAPDSPLNDLRVSFQLEPRLTRSLYMGDRWTSPASYLQVGAGESCTLVAGIRGLNAQGKAVTTPATWRAADPDMVKISEPGPGNTVKLTVMKPGKTTLEIASQGITKELPLHAVSYGDTLMVAMLQE